MSKKAIMATKQGRHIKKMGIYFPEINMVTVPFISFEYQYNSDLGYYILKCSRCTNC